MLKQCKYYDMENDTIHGGIIDTDNNVLICACCGSIYPLSELDELDMVILKIYDEWVDFSDEIIAQSMIFLLDVLRLSSGSAGGENSPVEKT